MCVCWCVCVGVLVCHANTCLRSHCLCLCLQFDFVELLDGRRLLAQGVQSLDGPPALTQSRSLVLLGSHDTGFIQYMDSGIWHLAVYNDGKDMEQVSFLTTAIGE